MSESNQDAEFYVGYLPGAPSALATFSRGRVARLAFIAAIVAVVSAFSLPYFGDGIFEYGDVRGFRGVAVCDAAARLSDGEIDYLLVGPGKNGVPAELCAIPGAILEISGTRFARGGVEALEVESFAAIAGSPAVPPASVPLGRMTLAGEIVDPKCYFGVMNPGEGRVHRACATLCLRGGISAVFAVRDRSGKEAHFLLASPDGAAADGLLEFVAEPVEITGEVSRQGQWLVLRADTAGIRRL